MSHHLVAFIFLFGTLAPTACAGVGPKDAVVLMIRHAEKPDYGVGLAPRGEQRAQTYPGYFCPFKGDAKPLRLDAIFATADSASSQRSNLTIAPLGNAMGIPVNTRYATRKLTNLRMNSAPRNRAKTCSSAGTTAKYPTSCGYSAPSPRPCYRTAHGQAKFSIGSFN